MAVAESGIRDGDDAERLAAAGFAAVLVGETLVRSGDRAAAGGGPALGTGSRPGAVRRPSRAPG